MKFNPQGEFEIISRLPQMSEVGRLFGLRRATQQPSRPVLVDESHVPSQEPTRRACGMLTSMELGMQILHGLNDKKKHSPKKPERLVREAS